MSKKILLTGSPTRYEDNCLEVLAPGHVLEYSENAGEFGLKKNTKTNAGYPVVIADESPFVGIGDTYKAGVTIPYFVAYRGVRVQVILKANENALKPGDLLTFGESGTVKKHAGNAIVIGVCMSVTVKENVEKLIKMEVS